MGSYRQKVIIAGGHTEAYTYENAIRTGHTHKHRHIKKRRPNISDELKPATSLKDSLSRTRQQITRLVNSNPQLCLFVTLTYAENMCDLTTTNADFHNFIKRLRRLFPKCDYVNVAEFQMRGAVHYHLLLDIKYIDSKLLAKVWGHGFVKIRAIEEIENVGLYISSYIRKELMDSRLFGRQKYMRSKGLKNPVVRTFKKPLTDSALADMGCNLVKENDYENEYIGKVNYKMFKNENDNLVLPENMR